MVDRGMYANQEICFLNDQPFSMRGMLQHQRPTSPSGSIKGQIQAASPFPSMKTQNLDSWTVICGRGKQSYDNVGNKRLRVLVDLEVTGYMAATTKVGKTTIVTRIVDTIREASQTGGFVQLDTTSGLYQEVKDTVAREKVGQLLREAIAKRNPTKLEERRISRQRRRKAARAEKKQLMQRSSSSVSWVFGKSVALVDVVELDGYNTM